MNYIQSPKRRFFLNSHRSIAKTAAFAAMLASLLIFGLVAPTTQPTSSAPAVDRWESVIAEFEAYDRKNTPPRDPILFTGSSTIVMWPTAKSFPNQTILNRGFGGSQYSDLVRYYDRVIRPYRPRAIVLYSGDNDIAEGRSPEDVQRAFHELLTKIRADFPKTPVIVLSTKPSGSRWALWPAMQQANRLIADECKRDEAMQLIDIGAGLLNASGEPRSELFGPDSLHLNVAGYAVLNEKLRPILDSLK